MVTGFGGLIKEIVIELMEKFASEMYAENANYGAKSKVRTLFN